MEPIYSAPDSTPIRCLSGGRRAAEDRQQFPPCVGKPPLPPGLRLHQEAIYSVVNKVKGEGAEEAAAGGGGGGGNSRREELENWLRETSRERAAMFGGSGEDGQVDWRGVNSELCGNGQQRVGLVGPYR